MIFADNELQIELKEKPIKKSCGYLIGTYKGSDVIATDKKELICISNGVLCRTYTRRDLCKLNLYGTFPDLIDGAACLETFARAVLICLKYEKAIKSGTSYGSSEAYDDLFDVLYSN